MWKLGGGRGGEIDSAAGFISLRIYFSGGARRPTESAWANLPNLSSWLGVATTCNVTCTSVLGWASTKIIFFSVLLTISSSHLSLIPARNRQPSAPAPYLDTRAISDQAIYLQHHMQVVLVPRRWLCRVAHLCAGLRRGH